jgi:hypothetical protein
MRANGLGGVAERLIAPVLKTGRPKGLVSSNLTPSVLLRASLRFAGSASCFEPKGPRQDCKTHVARIRTPSQAPVKEGPQFVLWISYRESRSTT